MSSTPPPVSTEADVFSGENFSADLFLADCIKKGQPLEQLATEITRLETTRYAELVELINAHYSDFLNVSASLGSVDKVLSKVATPLAQLSDTLDVCIVGITLFIIKGMGQATNQRC